MGLAYIGQICGYDNGACHDVSAVAVAVPHTLISLRAMLQKLIAVSTAVALCTATCASVLFQPYSIAAPKRILLQHVFEHDVNGSVLDIKLAIGGSDAVPVSDALQLSTFKLRNSSYRDWQVQPRHYAFYDA